MTHATNRLTAKNRDLLRSGTRRSAIEYGLPFLPTAFSLAEQTLHGRSLNLQISASEVTTLWRYTNLFIIIIIFDPGTQFPGNEKYYQTT